ncbi:MAG: Hsp33 family molecular chaperone HslO, partial [Oscillospiraceae bacterium]
MSENKKPNVIRAISTDGAVACCVIDSSAICGYSERIHRTSPTVTTALGRLLTAASMMGCMLKGKKDALTIKIAGDGEI